MSHDVFYGKIFGPMVKTTFQQPSATMAQATTLRRGGQQVGLKFPMSPPAPPAPPVPTVTTSTTPEKLNLSNSFEIQTQTITQTSQSSSNSTPPAVSSSPLTHSPSQNQVHSSSPEHFSRSSSETAMNPLPPQFSSGMHYSFIHNHANALIGESPRSSPQPMDGSHPPVRTPSSETVVTAPIPIPSQATPTKQPSNSDISPSSPETSSMLPPVHSTPPTGGSSGAAKTWNKITRPTTSRTGGPNAAGPAAPDEMSAALSGQGAQHAGARQSVGLFEIGRKKQ